MLCGTLKPRHNINDSPANSTVCLHKYKICWVQIKSVPCYCYFERCYQQSHLNICCFCLSSVSPDEIIWPEGDDALPADAQDLITRLLRQSPLDRLGTSTAC